MTYLGGIIGFYGRKKRKDGPHRIIHRLAETPRGMMVVLCGNKGAHRKTITTKQDDVNCTECSAHPLFKQDGIVKLKY